MHLDSFQKCESCDSKNWKTVINARSINIKLEEKKKSRKPAERVFAWPKMDASVFVIFEIARLLLGLLFSQETEVTLSCQPFLFYYTSVYMWHLSLDLMNQSLLTDSFNLLITAR